MPYILADHVGKLAVDLGGADPAPPLVCQPKGRQKWYGAPKYAPEFSPGLSCLLWQFTQYLNPHALYPCGLVSAFFPRSGTDVDPHTSP